MSAEDEALLLAKFVGNVGGCIPAAALPILVKSLQEKYDLREKLRISQENVKFLQMQFFLVDGKIDEATEALGSALAGGKASEAISQPPE